MCRVYLAAAGSQDGCAELFGSGMGASLDPEWAHRHQPPSLLVPLYRVDSVVDVAALSQPLVIVVDVEGTELDVLMGMPEFLDSEPAPVWVVEIAFYTHRAFDAVTQSRCLATFDLFFDRGYQCLGIAQDMPRITAHDVRQASKRAEAFGEVRNFIFFKGDHPLAEHAHPFEQGGD